MKTYDLTSNTSLLLAIRFVLEKRFYVSVPSRLGYRQSFSKDLGISEAELCELANELEEMTGLEVDNMSNIQTVGDLVQQFHKPPLQRFFYAVQ
ncbi:MAG: hypothetical protein QM669_11515 [Siphonobacter sp.]